MARTDLIKKQHYVPQFLLNKFSNRNGKIWVFDKATGRKFQASSGDIAHQNYFYAIPDFESLDIPSDIELTDVQRINSIEEFLRDVDGESGSAIDSLLKGIEASKNIAIDGKRRYFLNQSEKEILSIFMIYQEMRTESFREKIAQQFHLGYQAMTDMIINTKMPELKGKVDVQFTESAEKLNHIKMLLDEGFVRLLQSICLDKVWMIGYNDTDLPLLCSDHPVVMYSAMKNRFFGGAAWATPKTEICVPLSPKILLMLQCRSLFKVGPPLYSIAKSFDNRLRFLTRENVLHYNYLQYHYSSSRLFSNTEKFEYIEKFMSDHPKGRDSSRQRISVNAWGSELRLPENWKNRHKKIYRGVSE